jgi:uncharacterized protein YndB with AHSA1/START domain
MMTHHNALRVSAHGDREIRMTRGFRATRERVFEAYTEPELVERWLGVRGGWSFAVCEIDLRVGGAYRYVWRHDERGEEIGVSGIYREIVAPERIVCTERFDESWYPGEAQTTILLTEDAGETTLTMIICYESREARDHALATPMKDGVAESYDRLARLVSDTGDSERASPR